MVERFKATMAMMFSALFLLFSVALGLFSIYQFIAGLAGDELVSGFVRSINTAVIALATFELGLGIGKEYTTPEEGHSIVEVVRRTVARFVALVSIALVLEGLIMVIKYSQLELAGNLYYPVAIITAAALLLAALGVFLHLTRGDVQGVVEAHAREAATDEASDEGQVRQPRPVASSWTEA